MLDGLENVPWAKLEASCGRAERVPHLLMKLVACSPNDRPRVGAAIEGVLTGQGELFAATPYAVPFLLEILEAHHPASEYVYPILWEIGNIRAVAQESTEFRLPNWPSRFSSLKEACREAVRHGVEIYLRDAQGPLLSCRRGAFELLAEFLVDDPRVRALLPDLANQEPDDSLRRDVLELLDEYQSDLQGTP